MRLINKKYLIFLTSILLVIISILVIKQTKSNELSEVKLTESSNNNSFAMYRETNNGYEEYNEDKFPEGYVLNINESKCLDNKGNEQKGILSYENGLVTVISGNTSYCYLYFDKTLGVEIKDKNSNGLKTDKIRGDMYRYQGQQTDNIENYICFGTSDLQTCKDHPDQYMYRIIGIEAKTGRIKVIKKEALDNLYQWYTDYVTDVKLPDSIFFKAINGEDFLDNPTYIPAGWKEKIANNNWLYGDMWDDDIVGAKQMSEGLYGTETGQKPVNWYLKSTEEEGGSPYVVGWEYNNVYPPGTTLYYKIVFDIWNDVTNSKISLMYLHDYSYSVSDEAKCEHHYEKDDYSKCKLSWMYLSNNDLQAPNADELTMIRNGWNVWSGAYRSFYVSGEVYTSGDLNLTSAFSIRPVFYIDASQTLKDGTGKLDDPFLIN